MRCIIAGLLVAALAAVEPVLPAPPPEVARVQLGMLRGVLAADPAIVHPLCDEAMREVLTRAQLAAVREAVLERIDRAAVFTYIGSYMRRDMQVHLFKAPERSSGDELLMSVTMGNGVCTGLLFQ